MLLHTVHDMLAFMIVGATNSNGVILRMSAYDIVASIIVGIAGLVLGSYLIRKSVRADIVEVWTKCWENND